MTTAAPGFPLVPVAGRSTIQDRVHEQLRFALMSGHFDPGQTLTLASLAEAFDTSLMPVREALRRLAAENALEISTSGSARVPLVSAERLDDLCRARVVNEALAVELALPAIGLTELAMLEANIREHRAASGTNDVHRILAKNTEFHFAIYGLARSPVLLQIIESLWLRFGPYMRMLSNNMMPLLQTSYSETYTDHHVAMLEAARGQDLTGLRDALTQDILATRELVRDLCIDRSKAG